MPPTLKQLKKARIDIASKLLKKDQDFSPISPELIKDLRDRTLFASSPMRLSFAQYDKMCNDDEVLGMMSIVLNKPKAKLKKFCKYLSVFKQNIHLSPKSIAYKINGPICNLPENIRSTILDKFAEILPSKYVLLDSINKDKLNWIYLSSNPNAIDLLKENKHKIAWGMLSMNTNPNAIDLLKIRIEYENSLSSLDYNNLNYCEKINWDKLSSNPNAIDLLKENKHKIDWNMLSMNTNPNAIKLLKENKLEIDWGMLSMNTNPNAIELLKERIKYEETLPPKESETTEETDDDNTINWESLSGNENAIDIITKKIEYENSLSSLDYNKLNYKNKINWDVLSTNPNAIDLLQKQENKDRINWIFLSKNSNAIDLLKENKHKIDWDKLSKNTNPNAIDLLEKHKDQINWIFLSSNPNAIKLLKERINYENNLTPAQYNKLKHKDRINWTDLSTNPAIFKAV